MARLNSFSSVPAGAGADLPVTIMRVMKIIGAEPTTGYALFESCPINSAPSGTSMAIAVPPEMLTEDITLGVECTVAAALLSDHIGVVSVTPPYSESPKLYALMRAVKFRIISPLSIGEIGVIFD